MPATSATNESLRYSWADPSAMPIQPPTTPLQPEKPAPPRVIQSSAVQMKTTSTLASADEIFPRDLLSSSSESIPLVEVPGARGSKNLVIKNPMIGMKMITIGSPN